MKTYRLDPTKLKEQTRNIYLMYGITLVVLLVLNFFMYRGREVNSQTYLMFGLIVVMFVFVGWNAVRQRKNIWDQYELTVDANGIMQKQPKAADLYLPRAEVTGMKESKYGVTLMVKDQHPVMGIPKLLTLTDYEEIKGIVDGWIKNAKPVVLDAEVIEDVQALLPEEPKEVEPEELPEGEPEGQEPPETPEVL